MNMNPGSKVITTGTMKDMPKATLSGGDNSVHGSARTYPKGKGHTPNASKFNPMNTPASTYGLKGV